MPFAALAVAGLLLGVLASRQRPVLWAAGAGLAIGLLLAMVWLGAILISGNGAGADPGPFLLAVTGITGAGSLCGAAGARLAAGLRRRLRRGQP